MKIFSHVANYLLIGILCVFALLPLFHTGFFPMHDDEQVGRLFELNKSLHAGEFPVRLAQDLGFGFDYPLFNFYPSFIYYFAEIFVLLGFGYIVSIKIMIACGFLFSAWFMYLFTKEYLGKYAGIIAAVAYTYAPYHSVDVYVRGALPEFWSFVFVPALFYSYKKLAETKNNMYVILAGVLYCGLILTHNLVAMMCAIFLAIYILYLLILTKSKPRFIVQLFISGLLALLLSASFWIPSFFERNDTMINLLTTELADYNQHFVYLRQLWDSPWGYGGSLYGLQDGLSFQIGKMHLIGSLLAVLITGYLFLRKKIQFKIIAVFIVLFIVGIFMTTFYSEFVWKSLPLFAYIQFPWRFLLFTAFASSFLLGTFMLLFKSIKFQIVITSIFVFLIIFSYYKFFVPLKYLESVNDASYTNPSVINWRTSIMSFEYVPKGVKTKMSGANTTVIDISQNDIPKKSFQILAGNIVVQEISNKTQDKKFQIKGNGGVLQLETFAFPGWVILIDNKRVNFESNNKYKLMTFKIPAGNHLVEAKFTDTPLRSLGNGLSAASILGIVLYIIGYSRAKFKRTKKINDAKRK